MLPYVVSIRREIHQYPEIGFDLPRTLALVRRELTAMGIPFTEAFGKSSIVATLNEEKAGFTIGIRADMDALPITEKTGLPYASKNKGAMHACGHDAHTAILLETARRLSARKDAIACRVKFLFQSAEEYAPSGAKLMAEDGVMEDIDCVIALHCDVNANTGAINLASGPINALSHGFMLDFYGKSAHVANQEDGVDALMMAVKAYTAIEMMIAKEVPARRPCIFNVGSMHGGESNNSLCDHAYMYCTLRTWDEASDARVTARIKAIIAGIAKESGGRAKYTRCKFYPIVYNDEGMTERIRAAAEKVVGPENIWQHKRTMGGEDFSYFASRRPGCMFRLGIRNEEKRCIYSMHQSRTDIDEDAMPIGAAIFEQFVTDNMYGF